MSKIACTRSRFLSTQRASDFYLDGPHVKNPTSNAVQSPRTHMRTLAKNLLVASALALVVIYFVHLFPRMQKGLDFPDFYAAARMVHDGRGRELYAPFVQNQYLIRYSGRVGTYFIHPPFETLVYLPFAIFPLPWAYALWSIFQAIQLVAVASLLETKSLIRVSWRLLVPIFLLFVPLLLDFLQGQDSLLLLLLLTSAFALLESKRNFAGGCLLGCGLFKFHLAFPASLPSLLCKPKTLWWGLASVAVALLLVSIWISGWGAITAYPHFLLQLGSLPLAGIHNSQKANLRGLFALILPGSEGTAFYLTLLGSAFLTYLAVHCNMLAQQDRYSARLAFANAVFAGVLVGYHLSPHDLTILLLPMILLVDYLLTAEGIPRRTRWVLLLTLGVFFLPPLHLLLLRAHRYSYACIPILVLFGVSYSEISRRNLARADLQAPHARRA
jgi:hypothetical protein